ncbi:MAG: alpha/beta hydrolase [Chloroflexota bacterium]|nr:alpha/beta hydrolase [Chloroflexota bacterium]
MKVKSDFAEVNGARLYYERSGHGKPLVMIHAGIADCRMWDKEFEAFSQSHQALRFDMRGYGRSMPAEGEFNLLDDLETLLAKLDIPKPMILMGCSMGGGLSIDYALTHPAHVKALILVGSDPAGLELDAPWPDELVAQSESAFEAGDVDLVAELDMRIWFDGDGRTSDEVDSHARRKAYAMAKLVTEHELKGIGTHVRKSVARPAAERLPELTMPALIVIGQNDLPYLKLAADYMRDKLPAATKLLIPDAGHLPNLEHPELFRTAVLDFLGDC